MLEPKPKRPERKRDRKAAFERNRTSAKGWHKRRIETRRKVAEDNLVHWEKIKGEREAKAKEVV